MSLESEYPLRQPVTRRVILFKAHEDLDFWQKVAQSIFETELNTFMKDKPSTPEYDLVRDLTRPENKSDSFKKRKELENALIAIGFPMKEVYSLIVDQYAKIHNWEIVD